MNTLKWKIFRLASYFHIAAALGLDLLMIFNAWPVLKGIRDILMFYLFNLFFLVLIINSLINLFLLERCYPDQQPSRSLKIWNLVLYILFLPILTGAIFVAIIAGIEIVPRVINERYSLREVLPLAIISVLGLTGLPICFFQLNLRAVLRRNYKKVIADFLTAENA